MIVALLAHTIQSTLQLSYVVCQDALLLQQPLVILQRCLSKSVARPQLALQLLHNLVKFNILSFRILQPVAF